MAHLSCRMAGGVIKKDALCVRQIYCVGQNYPLHAKEMGLDPHKEPPVFFCKGAGALLPIHDDKTHSYAMPLATDNLQAEVELVLFLGSGGVNLSRRKAQESIAAYGVGLDMTRRDLQHTARAQGLPWDMAKHFAASAPCGVFSHFSHFSQMQSGRIWLTRNDEVIQDAALEDRLWDDAAAVAALSRYQHLHAGDVLFTGTPQGMHTLRRGDTLCARIEGLDALRLKIV